MEARSSLGRAGAGMLGAGLALWCLSAVLSPGTDSPPQRHRFRRDDSHPLTSYLRTRARVDVPTVRPATVQKTAPIFDPDDDLAYTNYRVPALVEHAGLTLAFAVASDSWERHAESDIVLKRSSDRGESWSEELDVIVGNRVGIASLGRASRHGTEYGNPVPISCSATADVLLVFSVNQTKVFLTRSADGVRWSPPSEIEGVKVPGWGTLVPGPGHGLELRHGLRAGRLVVPFNHMLREATVVATTTYRPTDPDDPRSEPTAVTRYEVENPHARHVGLSHDARMREHVEGQVIDERVALEPGADAPARAGLNAYEARSNHAAALYSDDHGATWHAGEDVPHLGSGEVSMAELPSGALVASFRVRHRRDGACRHFAASADAGGSWVLLPQAGSADSPPNCTVVDPGCQGALISNGEWLYASGPHDPHERRDLALYASADGGEHWQLIARPAAGARSAGSSDMVVWQPYGVHPWPEVGLAFEQGGRSSAGAAIMHTRISLGNE